MTAVGTRTVPAGSGAGTRASGTGASGPGPLRRTLPVISSGGALGAAARYGIELALPPAPGGFPWTTFAINASGCLLIGVLMVLVSEIWPHRPLIRPLLGVGVLGGFTTFSTYIVEIQRLVTLRQLGLALGYLAGTVVAAVAAAYLGTAATRWALRRRPARTP